MSNAILKYLSLSVVVPHSIIYTIIAAKCRTPNTQGHVFFAPTAVCMMELGKLLASLIAVAITQRSGTRRRARLDSGAVAEKEALLSGLPEAPSPTFSDDTVISIEYNFGDEAKRRQAKYWEQIITPDAWRLAVPAVLFVVQNNMQVLAAGFLTPAEYQILTQLKLVATALFSIAILRRRLNVQHWVSIFTLILGIIIVQSFSHKEIAEKEASLAKAFHIPNAAEAIAMARKTFSAARHIDYRSHSDLLVGSALMVAASTCSGLAVVLIEKMIKGAQNFWVTNVHLATFSLAAAALPVLADACVTLSPFRYFTPMVWLLIAMNVMGGIMIAMVLKHSDSISKNFAVAISLVGTMLVGATMTHIRVSNAQIFGTFIVVGSTFSYSYA